MATFLTRFIARTRRPEYTGENRCLPCTVVNSLITVFLAGVLTVSIGVRWSPVGGILVGAVVLVIGAAAIGLRGYLIPGTPQLTRRYFPNWLLGYFDKQSAGQPGTVDAEAILLKANAIELCPDDDDLCLTASFEEQWRVEMDRLHDEETTQGALAQILGLDADAVEFEEFGRAFVARYDGTQIGRWESEAALIADLAGARVLTDRDAGFESYAIEDRGAILQGLRVFVSRCPSCGEAVELSEETATSCCSSRTVATIECTGCGSRLFETPVPAGADNGP